MFAREISSRKEIVLIETPVTVTGHMEFEEYTIEDTHVHLENSASTAKQADCLTTQLEHSEKEVKKFPELNQNNWKQLETMVIALHAKISLMEKTQPSSEQLAALVKQVTEQKQKFTEQLTEQTQKFTEQLNEKNKKLAEQDERISKLQAELETVKKDAKNLAGLFENAYVMLKRNTEYFDNKL